MMKSTQCSICCFRLSKRLCDMLASMRGEQEIVKNSSPFWAHLMEGEMEDQKGRGGGEGRREGDKCGGIGGGGGG